jgi:hypothetical protein
VRARETRGRIEANEARRRALPGGTVAQVIVVVASCAIGTDPCNDSSAVYRGFAWWAAVIATVVALALVAGLVALLVRAHRHRPWD